MAPYNFDAPDTNVILRSSDLKELHVHKLILTLASPVFGYMFSLPQTTEPPSEIPTIDVPESSGILRLFLQYLYPRSPPKVSDLKMWEALYTTADKYIAEAVMDSLRDMLIHRFLETSPLRVYALASYWGFKEIAKIACTKTLMIDIFKDFPEEDAELMGGGACKRLCLLHFNRREAIRGVVANHRLKFSAAYCCPANQTLRRLVGTKPWLITDELQKEVYCVNCRSDVDQYFYSILKGISKLDE